MRFEETYHTGAQMLPGQVSGLYHGERCHAVRQMLERSLTARFIEVIDLCLLKTRAPFQTSKGHMGWNPTNILMNLRDQAFRRIVDEIVTAL